MPKKQQLDFDQIARLALGYAEQFMAEWLPDGKRESNEWSALNPTRPDSSPGSFKVNLTTGKWSDFAEPDAKGGDLISLYAYIFGETQIDAAKALNERLGGVSPPPKKTKKELKNNIWKPIVPVPDDAPEPPIAHYRFGLPSMQWTYRDRDGLLLGFIWRHDRKSSKRNGKIGKDFTPLTFCESIEGPNVGKRAWQFRSWEPPRPMYGLDRLAADPDRMAIVVEGEKCADAGNGIFDDYAHVVAWPGGAKAIGQIDFSPLEGRTVVLWPDNDEASFAGFLKLYDILIELAASVVIVRPPDGKAKGWDIADAVQEGWDFERLTLHLAKSRITPDELREKVEESKRKVEIEKAKKRAGAEDGEVNLVELFYDENGRMMRTDHGDAVRLMKLFGDRIRYNAKPFGAWFVFEGGRWLEDKTNRIFAYVDELVKAYYTMAGMLDKESSDRVEIVKHAVKLESMNRQRSIVAKAQTLQDLAVRDDEFDTHIYLFNCKNGTVDLTMEDEPEVVFRDHKPDDFMTKMSGAEFDPEADCPNWMAFLEDIFKGDQELIEFMQRAVGYSLTGDISEEVMFFAYGTGANGKSVFFNALDDLFGEYFGRAPSEMMMQQKFAQIPTDVADLKGQRFVVCSEIEENRRLYESKVKDLTGADKRITARRMREDFFHFTPTHKLWMFGNHEPKIYGNDDGIWRRIRKIPFTYKVPALDRQPMRVMLSRFSKELSGMLNWAIEGYRRYRDEGFNEPEVITEAVRDYRNRMDIVGQFVDVCCAKLPSEKMIAGEMFRAYERWSEDNGEKPIGGRKFYDRLRERGYEVRPGAQNKSYVYGLVLAEGAQENIFGGPPGADGGGSET